MGTTGATGVALAIAMMAGALGASGTAAEQDFLDRVRADALAASGGDLDRVGGTLTTHGPDGPIVRPITGHEFLELASRLPRGADGARRDDPGPGLGLGSYRLSRLVGWPWCTDATAWTYARDDGTGGAEVRALILGTGDGPVCGGTFGPSHRWLVEMKPQHDAVASCIAAAVVTPHPAGASAPGPGLRCGATHLLAHGNGVFIRLRYGEMVIDWFLGGDSQVAAR